MIVSGIKHPQTPDRPLTGLKIAVDAGNGSGGFFATQVGVPLTCFCIKQKRVWQCPAVAKTAQMMATAAVVASHHRLAHCGIPNKWKEGGACMHLLASRLQ
jgi:hypothetical protein